MIRASQPSPAHPRGGLERGASPPRAVQSPQRKRETRTTTCPRSAKTTSRLGAVRFSTGHAGASRNSATTARQFADSKKTTGLSRGAIFHHFKDKDGLFLALASEDARRMADVAAEAGPRSGHARHAGSARAIRLARTRLEIARRLRTDADFRAGWTQRSAELTDATVPSRQSEVGGATARRRTHGRSARLPRPRDGRPGRPNRVGPGRRKPVGRSRSGRGIGSPTA